MRKLLILVVTFSAAFLAAAACGSESQRDEDECETGSEGCPCYGNDTCNAGLDCLSVNQSKLCVDLGGGGSGGGGGNGCPSDREECSGTCVDLDGDENNCGSCGNACGSGEDCTNGECSCLAGREACGAGCVDTTSDPDHCGTCDAVCPEEQVCSESACSDDCANELTRCDRSCVNTATSTEHCGACDSACISGHTCSSGECVCPDALTSCGESCVDLSNDSAHCGECERACGVGEGCMAGECECAPGSTRCGDECVTGDSCGTGGSGGMGGSTSGGSAGMGGAANGGSAGMGGSNGGAGGSGGAPSGPPIVQILVDNSSSMYEPRAELWDALYSALMDETDGVVGIYEDRVRIGLSTFRGPDNISVPESDTSCAQIEVVGAVSPATVAPAFDNRSAIDTVYRALGEQGRGSMGNVDAGIASWETPTGHALKRVADTLAGFSANPAGRKYIFLLTDGNPNTCLVGDPQCGQDLAVKAAQDARVVGVTTLILGFGDVVGTQSGCTATQMPCGERHLQDMANAGTAQPVEAPMQDYWYQSCPRLQSNAAVGVPAAAYVPAGTGGTAEFYTGMGRDALRGELVAMFDRVVAGSVP
jgi:hypothetical protein